MKITENTFVVVDGSSYLFRAYHALPPLTTAKGQPTGAIYGMITMLQKLLSVYKPQYIVVVFDSKERNFRHELYPEYKANRAAMPEELQAQIAPLHHVIEAMGLPVLVMPGVEADDIIGTLAKKADGEGLSTIISSGDKDFAQLLDRDTRIMINPMTGEILDRKGVEKKFEVQPEQIVDYLTLIGDSVDNVPGVPKVGPKTASKWLQTYGSLEKIQKHATDIPGKVGENLRDFLPRLSLSRQLIVIKEDVPLSQKPKDFIPKAPDYQKLYEWFTELEFKSLLKKIESEMGDKKENIETIQKKAKNEKHYETILTQEQLMHWIKKLKQAKYIAIDTETTSLDPISAELVGISFSVEPERAAYIPLMHDYIGAPLQLDKAWVLDSLRPLLESPKLYKLGHNLKYDLLVFWKAGIDLQGVHYDSMLESYILDSSSGRHNLDLLAERYLDHTTIRFEEVAGKGKNALTFNLVPIEPATTYAAEDADIALQLHQVLYEKLSDIEGLKRVFETIEIPLLTVLARMEKIGVLIDSKKLKKQSEELEAQLSTLEKKAHQLADATFNLNSPKQLQEILFQKHQLPILEKTPTGQPSTAESVLEELALQFPLPKIILEYRSLSKLKSTYTDALPQQINPLTGRVHTSYNQTVAATGRLSSSDPNLQNIPIRTPEGRRIRSAFIAPKGYQILSADYSQIELRILAHFSEDKVLLKAFSQGEDIHRITAAEVFHVNPKDVIPEQRRKAKIINFGLLYGMSAFGLSKQLAIPREEAQHYMDQYFMRFPSVHGFMESIREKARKEGFVETLLGRRLYLPDINSRNVNQRRMSERAAINAPMQGTAADIIKRAMIDVDECIQKQHLPIQMIMQVHDELIFEVPHDQIDQAKKIVKECMESAAQLKTPLLVEIGVGDNWDEAH